MVLPPLSTVIDLEPNSDQQVKNIKLIDMIFENNTGFGFICSNTKNLLLHCTAKNNKQEGFHVKPNENLLIERSTFNSNP